MAGSTKGSLWMESEAGSRYPALESDATADVAVLGAGIAGMSVATLLRKTGLDVIVLEAAEVGSGVSGNTTAKVSSAHGLVYDSIRSSFGREGARAYAEANQAGLEWIAQVVSEHSIECDFRRRQAYTYATSDSERGDVEKEVEAALEAGLPVSFTDHTELPFPTWGAIRFENQAELHPRRYLAALAAAHAEAGGRIHEQTRATAVSGRGPHSVQTEPGATVRAGHVIVATHFPFLDRGLFFARMAPKRSYCIAVRAEGALPEGMYLSAGEPTRSTRLAPSPDGDGELLIVGGEGHKVGHESDTESRYEALEDWARDHFDVQSVDYRWSAQDNEPADHVPFVGKLTPLSENVLTATGFSKWGFTNGTAAAMMLTDMVLGRPNPWLDTFGSNRLKPVASAPSLLKENVDVGARFVGDRLATLRVPDVEELAPGEGAIASAGGEKVAAYRAQDGTLSAVSPVCTHLWCLVKFNTAEQSWDCPCHGSRFSTDGEVLQGPAVAPLARREPPAS